MNAALRAGGIKNRITVHGDTQLPLFLASLESLFVRRLCCATSKSATFKTCASFFALACNMPLSSGIPGQHREDGERGLPALQHEGQRFAGGAVVSGEQAFRIERNVGEAIYILRAPFSVQGPEAQTSGRLSAEEGRDGRFAEKIATTGHQPRGDRLPHAINQARHFSFSLVLLLLRGLRCASVCGLGWRELSRFDVGFRSCRVTASVERNR